MRFYFSKTYTFLGSVYRGKIKAQFILVGEFLSEFLYGWSGSEEVLIILFIFDKMNFFELIFFPKIY